MFEISLVVLGVGVLFLALAGISFKWRAIANKKAWEGKTKFFAVIGVIVFLLGLLLVYWYYPFK